MNWDELVKYDQGSALLKRRPDVQKEYDERLARLNSLGISLTDHIVTALLANDDYKFAPNNFPYDLAEGISHDILWIKPSTTLTPAEVEDLIKKEYPRHDVVHMLNAPGKCSVPGVPHYHVFTRLSTTTDTSRNP